MLKEFRLILFIILFVDTRSNKITNNYPVLGGAFMFHSVVFGILIYVIASGC